PRVLRRGLRGLRPPHAPARQGPRPHRVGAQDVARRDPVRHDERLPPPLRGGARRRL
ncbi:MAG: hypothetical protein AVDCRST_MAG79-727, partial [uncultured Thermoleophilia bacterium]